MNSDKGPRRVRKTPCLADVKLCSKPMYTSDGQMKQKTALDDLQVTPY